MKLKDVINNFTENKLLHTYFVKNLLNLEVILFCFKNVGTIIFK